MSRTATAPAPPPSTTPTTPQRAPPATLGSRSRTTTATTPSSNTTATTTGSTVGTARTRYTTPPRLCTDRGDARGPGVKQARPLRIAAPLVGASLLGACAPE